jgi:nitric oxide dioxygenase
MDSIIIRHLRESVALLPMEDLAPVDAFYNRLFELAPEVRPLFKRDMGLQAKKLSDMLVWVIGHLEHPEELSRELRTLGSRHRDYGVEIDQYAPLGSALIWMFQRTLGDRFSSEMEEAWLEAYAFISSAMERGAREATPVGTCPEPSIGID